MKAIGITCGIGSMLVGARAAGFKIEGNVEWRKYYHAKDSEGKNTFRENYPGALFKENTDGLELDEIERLMNADLALGHPECGAYSQLNANKAMATDPSDIPLFCDLIAKFKPRFFVMDDLPKSLGAFTMENYCDKLQGYDLFPEWVSNWGYGNVQKQRNRMFMIGARRDEGWAFVANEHKHDKMVSTILGDMPEPRLRGNLPNHDVHALDEFCAKGLHLKYRDHRATWQEMRDYVVNEMREGAPIQYYMADGSQGLRVGSYKGHWDGPAHVLTGGISGFHPHRGLPYTIRERAMIQGFPDDFIFYGTVYNERGEWNHDRNMHMVKQTGKAMPIQFCQYVSEQVAAHIKGEAWHETSSRVLRSNEWIDRAKYWYCENKGYANQEAACSACWLYDRCTIRSLKYGIGHSVATPVQAVVQDPPPAGTAPQSGEGDIPDDVLVTTFAPLDQLRPEKTRRVKADPKPRAPRPAGRFADVSVEETDLDFS